MRRKRIVQYMAGLSGLVLLIAAAFLIPQFIFRVQDDILCGDTVLGQRMHLDVEAMRTDYEKELPVRLENFVNGLMAGDVFYVTSQDMEIDQEIQEYLYSDMGLYQGIINSLSAIGLIDIWGRDFTINQWKRYVLYSDNYAKGVNFILWFIELQDSEEVLKLLVDGEDGTIYALKTEVGLPADDFRKGNYDYWAQMKSYLGEYMFFELWGYFTEYYELMTEEVTEKYHFWLEEIEKESIKTVKTELLSAGITDVLTDEEELTDIQEGKTEAGKEQGEEKEKEEGGNLEEWYAMKGENELLLMIPCGVSSLDVVLEMENPEYGYSMPNVTIGIMDIYERIPEF